MVASVWVYITLEQWVQLGTATCKLPGFQGTSHVKHIPLKQAARSFAGLFLHDHVGT